MLRGCCTHTQILADTKVGRKYILDTDACDRTTYVIVRTREGLFYECTRGFSEDKAEEVTLPTLFRRRKDGGGYLY